MLVSSAIAVVLALSAADGGAPAAVLNNGALQESDVSTLPVFVDEGVLLDTLNQLLDKASEPARIAVYVDDSDGVRQKSLERALVRALRDRRREDVVTPSLVKASLDKAAEDQLKGGSSAAAKSLAADHVIVATVVDAGMNAQLSLKLLSVEKGDVVGVSTVAIDGAAAPNTAKALDVRTAAADIADVIAEGVEARGVDVKVHRIAVPPATATGAAKEARLDRFVQSELTAALRDRGFLVVERAALGTAMDQLAIQELQGTERVAELGQLLGAQSLLLVQVNDDATTFVVSARAVSVEGGDVLAAASAHVGRDDVVSLAAVEMRTPGEAAVQSAIAPGWGQAGNGDGVKAVLFGVATYGSLATTAALGVGAGVSWASYNAVGSNGESPEEAGKSAVSLRNQTNGLLTATAVAGAVTASVWSLNIVDALLSAPSD